MTATAMSRAAPPRPSAIARRRLFFSGSYLDRRLLGGEGHGPCPTDRLRESCQDREVGVKRDPLQARAYGAVPKMAACS